MTLSVPMHMLFLEITRRRRDISIECIDNVLCSGFAAFRLAVKLGLAEKRESILQEQERVLSFIKDKKAEELEKGDEKKKEK